jgi:Flp pilus assembly protein CpaB
MGKRTIVLVVALLLAAIAAFSIYTYLQGVREDAEAEVQEVTVFRATAFIEAGVEGDAALQFIEASTENNKFVELTPAIIRSEDQLKQVLAGKAAAGPISEGQIITTDHWVELAELQTILLSELISPDSVAISIRPDEVAAVGGFIRPGDKVNVIASTTANLDNIKKILADPVARELFYPGLIRQLGIDDLIEEQIGQIGIGVLTAEEEAVLFEELLVAFFEALPTGYEFTATVMQEVTVLAVGPQVRDAGITGGLEPVGAQIITLEVSPAAAERIAYINQYLSYHLALLPEGYQPETLPGIALEDIFGLERLMPILEVGGGR